jgi:hypothetical protein
MFTQINDNDLKATNGGFFIPAIIWAFTYDKSRTNEAKRQQEQRRLEEQRITENYQADKALINEQHVDLNEQQALLDALDQHWAKHTLAH